MQIFILLIFKLIYNTIQHCIPEDLLLNIEKISQIEFNDKHAIYGAFIYFHLLVHCVSIFID